MIRLLVNADDLGMDPRIDAGIFEAHTHGIVTSATVLVTGRSAPAAIETAKRANLALGVHLCLSTGLRPASPPEEVPALAPGGKFRPSWVQLSTAWLRGQIPHAEVDRELRAQLDRARALGFEPDHL